MRSRVKIDDPFMAKYGDPTTWASNTITAYNTKLEELETAESDDDDRAASDDDDINSRAVVSVV